MKIEARILDLLKSKVGPDENRGLNSRYAQEQSYERKFLTLGDVGQGRSPNYSTVVHKGTNTKAHKGKR